MKDNANEFTINGEDKYVRDLYGRKSLFNKGYQPRSKSVNDEEGNLLADSHNILKYGKNNSVSY
jgi:hypothetical protein